MSELLRPRERKEETCYVLNFWYVGHEGSWGKGFDCNENGVPLDQSKAEDVAACEAGEIDGEAVVPGGIQEFMQHWMEPGELSCDCGAYLELDDAMTNTCDCGLEYNGSGQQLAPREQWGYDTGESAADMMAPGDPFGL